MNKKLLMAAVGAALVAGPMVAAQAAPTVYGHMHVSMDHYKADNASTASSASTERGLLNSNSSRIGIKGDEDLGGGLKAIYQIESGIVMVDDGSGGLGNQLRDTFVGFTGSWGAVKFGRGDTPMKNLSRALDAYNERIGDTRNIVGTNASGANAFDQRISNMARYDSPDFSGIRFALQYSTPEGTASNKRYTSGNVTWTSGPLFAGLGYEKHGLGTKVNGTDSEKATRLVGKYSAGDLTLSALYEQLSDLNGKTGDDRNSWGVGVGFKMANNLLSLQYGKADKTDKATAASNGSTDNSAKLWSLGVDHTFSKTTLVYFAYGKMDNGNGTSAYNVSSSTGGHGTAGVPTVGKLGGSSTAYSLGTIMKF